ncbi:uncharacterized protein LOC121693388, partial [Alosa sapidissima]|uniref:uncharacterized protein LOC121693388 n=1 Tax=Alosa sapidissima TaxID=34773 RepID=UPI001C097B40
MNRHSASSDSSHHFNISSKTVVPEANKRQNYMINALLKKQHTWRHLLLSSKSLDGMKISNDSLPQFQCDNESLVLRFTVANHTRQFLLNENFSPINIQHLPAHCRHTAEKRGPWMLLKVFFKGCYLHHKVMEWMQFHSVTVQYFDRELMRNVTAAAACLELTPSRAASRTVAPVVKCEKNEMTVKLLGCTLKHVLVSDLHVDQGKDVKQWTNNRFLYVKINIEKEQALTLIYLDHIGKLKKVKVSCTQKNRSRLPIATIDTDTDTETAPADTSTCTGTDTNMEALPTSPPEEFERFWEFWGFPDIPSGPYRPPGVTEAPELTTESPATEPVTTAQDPTTSITTTVTTVADTTTLAATTTAVPTTTVADTTTSTATTTAVPT